MKLNKKLLILTTIIVIIGVGFLLLNNKASHIYPIAAVNYSDGRSSISKRLEVKDQGVILGHGDLPSDVNGARDVFVYKSDGKYYMTYDGASSERWSVNLAVSSDLKSWMKEGTVLDKGNKGSPDSACAAYGTPYFTGSRWLMYYLGCKSQTPAPNNVPNPPYVTMLSYGDSPEGPWVKDSDRTLLSKPSETGSAGAIVKLNMEYRMFFTCENLTLCQASSRDLTHWDVDPDPILPPNQKLENTSIYYQKSDKTWFMFTNHVGIDKKGFGYTDAIWVYWTKDINHWSPENKAIAVDGSVSNWSKEVIGLPSVMEINGKLAIFYDGRKAGIDLNDPAKTHLQRDIGLA